MATVILSGEPKPLGLVFSDSMPMTVTEVHEEAQHMGIRVGDVLKGYGREWDLVGQLVVDVAFVGVCRKKYHLKCQEFFSVFFFGVR